MAKSVSILEISRAARVAKSTVSLALRNDPRVASATRLRIQALASKMGYKTNALVARLMYELRATKKERFIAALALVNCSPEREIAKRINWIQQTCDGAEERAKQLGYTIDNFWLKDPDIRIDRMANIFRARNIQGVIFHSPGKDTALIEHDPDGIIWNHFPSVTMGVRLRQPALPFSINDHYATGYQLGLKLRQLGYKRTGIAMDKWLDDELERRFVFGFLASQPIRNGVSPLYMNRAIDGPIPAENRQVLMKWLKKYKPDAFACLNRYVYDWIVEMGIRVPENLGVAFLDLTLETKGMSGMNQRPIDIGMTSVDLLIGQILRRENYLPDFQHGIMIESIWQMGNTVRAI